MIQIIVALILSFVILFLLLVIISAFFFAIDTFLDLPYVATDKRRIETIINLASIKRGETVIDLGSGDGRLLFAAAQKGARAIGYEINPFLVAITRIKARFSNLHPRGEVKASPRSHPAGCEPEVITKRQNLWKADLKVADVIFVYGRQKTMQKFQDFVYKNAKSGTRIVVNTNAFPNKKPIKSENGIFLYKI